MIYTTTQGDTWDLISFKLTGNEYFIDQFIAANPQQVMTTVFDSGTQLQVPVVVIPRTVSNVVWGSIVRVA